MMSRVRRNDTTLAVWSKRYSRGNEMIPKVGAK